MVGIIFIADVKYCPYLGKYTEVLEQQNREYEVLFWNRGNEKKEYPPNFISFNMNSKLDKHPLLKGLDFVKFKCWIDQQIKKRKYEKLIILSTLSGMLVSNILTKKYEGKYIFDIRDYSYENNKFFYNIEKNLIKKSFFTSISSDGFKEFLPGDQTYLTVHNFNNYDLPFRRKFKKKNRGDTLNIVFIGGVRYFSHQVKIINHLKNDTRFNLFYHGSGVELNKFVDYCKDEKIKNIRFTGEYDNSEKYKLLEGADILNNSYKDAKAMEILYAISNKFYDGLIFGIPQLVETNTYKHKKVEELGVGIGLDEEDVNFADKLYKYYFDIDERIFNRSCEDALSSIIEDDNSYKEKIKQFLEL